MPEGRSAQPTRRGTWRWPSRARRAKAATSCAEAISGPSSPPRKSRGSWPEQGPFDGILVTAAPPAVPAALLEQLADGGRLVVPVGADDAQELKIYDRVGDEIQTQTLDRVRFVPLLKGTRAK